MGILFGEGIDRMGCLLDAALDLGVVERKGSWYSYQDSNFAQGRFNAGVYLKENRAMAKAMEEEVREALRVDKMPPATEEDDAVEGNLASVSDETSVLE